MIDAFLVGAKTVVDSKGDGPAVDVSSAQSRVFLLSLEITNMIEQESLDVGIAGSGDGSTWNPKPIVSFPQKFYRGEQPLLLDLRALPETKFVRAHWEVNRWGRGNTTPMFEFQLRLKEVPPDILQQASLEAKIPA
jgi:hypothetical protein